MKELDYRGSGLVQYHREMRNNGGKNDDKRET